MRENHYPADLKISQEIISSEIGNHVVIENGKFLEIYTKNIENAYKLEWYTLITQPIKIYDLKGILNYMNLSFWEKLKKWNWKKKEDFVIYDSTKIKPPMHPNCRSIYTPFKEY